MTEIIKQANDPISERWIAEAELVKKLNTSKRQLRTWREQHGLTTSKLGHSIMYAVSDVLELLDENAERYV